MKNINVLFLFHDTNRNNGANRSLMDIIDTLHDNPEINITAAFPTSSGSAIDYLKEKGIRILPWRIGRWDYKAKTYTVKNFYLIGKKVLGGFYTYSFIRKFFKARMYNDFDLVYSNTFTINLGALLNKKFGIPHIWHIREFGMEDHQYSIIGGMQRLYNSANHYADKVILISHSLYNKYSNYIDKMKLEVIYNDISPSFITERESRFDFSQKVNLLIAGTIQRGKGQLDAIKATELLVKKGIPAKLYIAGNKTGEYYSELRKYVDTHSLNTAVEFTGYIKDMNSLRRKMDIAIVASSSEAFGRVTVEAMLSGLLVVGANVAGTSELVQDYVNGRLYNNGDFKDLANVLYDAIEHPDKTTDIAEFGHKEAIEKFTTGKCAKRVEEIFHELVEE